MKKISGMKMEMTGDQKGTINIKLDNGYIQSGAYKVSIKNTMEVMGKKIEMTATSDCKINGG